MALSPRLEAALEDRYPITRRLAVGGMAEVYLARDLRHDREIVIKALRPELSTATSVERFVREISLLARLQHPHILPLLDSGEIEGERWLAIPWIPGGTLAERLKSSGRLAVKDAVAIAREIAEALDAAHRLGIVHRDVKPGNILLGNGGALLADFGISSLADDLGDRLTASGVSVGTPAYMSPEQASGTSQVGPAADIYALGCVLFEMLGGQAPFPAPDARSAMARHVIDPVPSLASLRPGLPAELDALVQRALAKLPADRWESAGAMAEALAAPFDPTPSGMVPLRPRVRKGARFLAGLGMLFTLAAGGWLIAGAPAAGRAPVLRQVTFTGDVLDGMISPDGQFVAYLTLDSLLVLDLETGESVARASRGDAAYGLAGWDARGSSIVLVDRCGCRVVSLPRIGGKERVIADAPGTRMGTDGVALYRTITGPAIGDRPTSLGIVLFPDLADTASRDSIIWEPPVPDTVIRANHFALSPDRRWLAIDLGALGRWSLQIFDRKSRRFTEVDGMEAGIGRMAWGDNGRTLFVQSGDSLSRVRRRGDRFVRETGLRVARREWNASADGRRVLLWLESDASELFERTIEGDSVAALARRLPLGSARHKTAVSLAPGGERLVFLASTERRSGRMPFSVPLIHDLATGRTEPAPIDSARYSDASWSAHGDALLLRVQLTLQEYETRRLDLATGHVVVLGRASLFDEYIELGDGRILRKARSGGDDSTHVALWTPGRADTSRLALPIARASGAMAGPGGTAVAFAAGGEKGQIAIVDFRTGAQRLYEIAPGAGALPVAWSGDSALWLSAAARGEPHGSALWRLSLADGTVRPVTGGLLQGCRADWFSDARHAVICPSVLTRDLHLLEGGRRILH